MGRPACSLGDMMKALWWSCLLGLFCTPVEVTLSLVSQSPSSMSYVKVNSSLEITCSTSKQEAVGLSLHRYFHNNQIVYLHFKDRGNRKTTVDEAFKNRTAVSPSQQKDRLGFTVKLSLLTLDDTDLYSCQWIYFDNILSSISKLESNGTIIIIEERDPQDKCTDHTVDLNLIPLTVVSFIILVSIFIVALVLKCRRFKKEFPPPRPPSPDRPQHVDVEQQTPLHYSHLSTSNPYGFRAVQ